VACPQHFLEGVYKHIAHIGNIASNKDIYFKNMAVRRSSKIFTEIPQDAFQGQAPPGSQRRLSKTGSSSEFFTPGHATAASSYRQEEGHMKASRMDGDGTAETVPVFSESNHPPLPSRRKSNVGLPADAIVNHSLETDDPSASSAKGSSKSRRKSNAGLSINTAGSSVVDLRPDMAKTPSMKGGAPGTPSGSVKGPPTFIKDGAKRASSRLMLDKQMSAGNMNAQAQAVPIVDDDRRNSIDCDTCCIFIF
jgi:hypothetical protein